MNEAEIYRKAAELLRRNGWASASWSQLNAAYGPRCIGIALREAGGPLPNYYSTESSYPALQELLNDTCLAEFNDHHCETVDDALAALEIAADLAS